MLETIIQSQGMGLSIVESQSQTHIKSTSTSLSSQSQKQKKILVIDDNPDIVFTLRVGLESDPTMRVFGFDNPVTALVEFKPNFSIYY